MKAPQLVEGFKSSIGPRIDSEDFLWGNSYALSDSFVTPVFND